MKLLSLLLLVAAYCATSHAHPVPDIPVRSSFTSDGKVFIRVEVDPRCFTKDPLNEPYLRNEQFQSYTQKQKTDLLGRARKLILDSIEFRMKPGGRVRPEFLMHFTTFDNAALNWDAEEPGKNSIKLSQTPVVVTAEWITDASQASGYQIKSSKEGKYSIQFINFIGNKEQRLNVLFPGEESYVLDLNAWAKSLRTESNGAAEAKN